MASISTKGGRRHLLDRNRSWIQCNSSCQVFSITDTTTLAYLCGGAPPLPPLIDSSLWGRAMFIRVLALPCSA